MVAAVGARPAWVALLERCVAAVCWRPVVEVVLRVAEPDSCGCSLDDERGELAVCVVPVLCPSACVCVLDCEEEDVVELLVVVELLLEGDVLVDVSLGADDAVVDVVVVLAG